MKAPPDEIKTVSEAAQYVSEVLGRTFSEADLLRQALEGHIVLSIDFVNPVSVFRGKVVPASQAPWAPPLPKPGWLFEGSFVGQGMEEDQVMVIHHEEITEISGVWDLPMRGAEYLDVQRRRSRLMGGPAEIERISIEDVLVVRSGGEICRLLKHLGSEESNDQELSSPWEHSANFGPADSLPPQGILVIRMIELDKVYASLATVGTLKKSGTTQPAAAQHKTRPPCTQKWQEDAILAQLRKLGYDPEALEPAPSGRALRAKKDVQKALGLSDEVMRKAWRRLLADPARVKYTKYT